MSIKAKKRAAAPTPYSKSTSLKIISRVIIILLSLTVVYPLIFIVLVSFKNNQEFYSNIFGLPQVWRFENYAAAWVEGKIGLYAFNSIVVTVAAVIGSVLFTALGGYALSKMHIPGAKAIITALMTLNFVPGVAVYIPLYMQMIDMKLSGSLWMLILPYLTWHIPFSIYIFKNFFDSIPSELMEAARVDGSGEVRLFFKVILPLVRPAVATVMVFNFIGTWGE